MQQINEIIKDKKFQVKKARKNDERLRLIDRLAEVLGRNKRGLHFVTLIWTNEMLQDAIKTSQHFQDIQARNFHFNEYVKSTKLA